MIKDERIRALRTDFQKCFQKLDRLINSTSRFKDPETAIDLIRFTYSIKDKATDQLPKLEKM